MKRDRILVNSHTHRIGYVSQEIGSEVQVWHLSVRLKLRHHYMKFVSIIFSFSVSLYLPFAHLFLKYCPSQEKEDLHPKPVMWEKWLPFSGTPPPPPLYRFHTPGSILPLLRLYERGHLAGMRFIMKSSLSLEDSRPERVGKKSVFIQIKFICFILYEICISHDRNALI